jgi:hypothetical protein
MRINSDQGCLSQITDPEFYPFRILDTKTAQNLTTLKICFLEMMKKKWLENFLIILEVFSKIMCHKALKNICLISETEVLNVPS